MCHFDDAEDLVNRAVNGQARRLLVLSP